MLTLRRRKAFYEQPWFWMVALVLGQYYGVWWQSLGAAPPPPYHSPSVIIAVNDPFNITITAPGLHQERTIVRAN